MTNPLLNLHTYPQFQQIKAEHIEPAIDHLLAQNRATIAAIKQQSQPSWDSLVQPLEDMDAQLNRVWSVINQLNQVNNHSELRRAYHRCLPKLTAYTTELSQDKRLYQALQNIYHHHDFKTLTKAQQRVIELYLRDFKLNGVHLNASQKTQLHHIEQRLAQLMNQFEENVLDATDAWHCHITDEKRLHGIPDHIKEQFRQLARQRHQPGWVINLSFPHYEAVITHADDRELRREIYTAWNTRASDQGPHATQFDNSQIMNEIIDLRHQKALTLGFHNFAEFSLATKMARSSQEVCEFLQQLTQYVTPKAKQEWRQLQTFAQSHDQIDVIEAWDVAYLSEKQRQHQLQLASEDLRPYFPIEQVLTGLFHLTESLYNIHIREKTQFNRWHPTVRLFEIVDSEQHVKAAFYLDLYARARKRSGAWMAEYQDRHIDSNGKQQIPVAFINCNFATPDSKQPTLLSHEDVLTLFHEFGHGLHHMLTEVNIASIAGINNVPWDAVEFPSQLMEYFAWQKSVLDQIACHYQTQQPLPREYYRRLQQSQLFQTGLTNARQLEFALFDWRLHSEYEPNQDPRIQETLDQVRSEISVIPTPTFNRFQHSFSHIFEGAYAAGYYSYQWAEILACDAFTRFQQGHLTDTKVGQQFLQYILAQGSTEDFMTLFISFQGREPSINAFLRSYGFVT